MMGIPKNLQDAIICLSEVTLFSNLEESLKTSLRLALPTVVDTLVYILSSDDQDLISSQGVIHTLPKEGLTCVAVQRKERLVVESLDPADPISGLLVTGSEMVDISHRKVLCSPIIDGQTDKVVAVYAVLCDQLTDENHQFLSFLERQLMEETQSEAAFLLLVDDDQQELFCQVVCDQILNEEIRFPINDCCFSSVFTNKTPIPLEISEESPFNALKGYLTCEVKSSICIPVICRVNGDVMAITCLVNKRGSNGYSDDDECIVKHCFTYLAPVLHSTIAIQNERCARNQSQVLLQISKNLFTHIDDLSTLLSEIMQEARNLTKAERCSVFLLDKDTNELVAKVFDGDKNKSESTGSEIRIKVTSGIAGKVATTGELSNIDKPYEDPDFFSGIDEITGFKTRNILSFPIKNDKGEVVGVAQLCNKINGTRFTAFDVNIAQAFAGYCCVSIVHSLLYKKVMDSQHRSKLSNELMIYHMQTMQLDDPFVVATEDVTALSSSTLRQPNVIYPDIQQFSFTPRNLPNDDMQMPEIVLSMFEDLGFINRHRIQRDYLARFVLMVRRGYRDPPYHNWSHAFAVTHFCYLLFKNTNVLEYIDDVEAFSLFVSCLCHDIDHRGTTNAFQTATGSILATLYSSEGSVLERHHLAQTMCILNSDYCNILENLSKEDYGRALDLIKDIILATDLAEHKKKIDDFTQMSEAGYDRNNPQHKHLLLSLLMTSCDLSDQTKNFKDSVSIAELIYREFFSQGDKEKEMGRIPMAMMDRDVANIPQIQIGFLKELAVPCYKFLAAIFPSTKVVHDSAKHNCHVWEKIYKELLRRNLPLNMGVFQSLVVARFLENNDILALENDDALTLEIVEVLTPEIADDDLSSHDVDIEVDPAM